MTVERVNYYTGERLEAADLNLDQGYHINLRRLVNRGFFSPGVVQGLTLTSSTPTTVTVAAGFALDPQGREIVLTRRQKIAVPNKAPTSVGGYYLTIRYHENKIQGASPDCAPINGGPSRIEEMPVLAWTELWPDHSRCQGDPDSESLECAIVLALVTLDGSCHISSIETGVREIAHSILPGQVRSFQIEGEKDIAPGSSKRIHFNVRGGIASNVILQLWSGPFSSLHYSEIGYHQHPLSLSLLATKDKMGNHTHSTPGFDSGGESPALSDHMVRWAVNGTDLLNDLFNGISAAFGNHFGLQVGTAAGYERVVPSQASHDNDFVKSHDPHSHPIPANNTGAPSTNSTDGHAHNLSGSSAGAGANSNAGLDATARDGEGRYAYIDSLTVKLDQQPITQTIVGLMKPDWFGTLGNGKNDHPFVKDSEGTGPIYINRFKSIGPGMHTIELIVSNTGRTAYNGGKVMWSLTVE